MEERKAIEKRKAWFTALEWIGVGLDGTLANSKDTDEQIGQPIPSMVTYVTAWLEEGKDVRIVTPRVSPPIDHRDLVTQRSLIDEWCWEQFKRSLPVTATLSRGMKHLYMHNCVQIGETALHGDGS